METRLDINEGFDHWGDTHPAVTLSETKKGSTEAEKSYKLVNSSRAPSMNVSTSPSGQVVSALTHMNAVTVGARR